MRLHPVGIAVLKSNHGMVCGTPVLNRLVGQASSLSIGNDGQPRAPWGVATKSFSLSAITFETRYSPTDRWDKRT